MSRISPVAAAERRRADAAHNIEAILDAALELLSEHPEATMAEIAAAAGVARQTVYAHYSSRGELVNAVINRAIEETAAALDAAKLNQGPPEEALPRLIDAGWERLVRHSRLRGNPDAPNSEELYMQHGPIVERLARLIRRGQRSGAFDRQLSPTWLLAATLGLLHAAADEVAAGRLTGDQAATALKQSIPRLFESTPQKARPRPRRRVRS
jgi:AcrR family transcriptional regulator